MCSMYQSQIKFDFLRLHHLEDPISSKCQLFLSWADEDQTQVFRIVQVRILLVSRTNDCVEATLS